MGSVSIQSLRARAKTTLAGAQPGYIVSRYSVEIGNGTYFRRPVEMLQTTDHWQRSCIEALVRDLRDMVPC